MHDLALRILLFVVVSFRGFLPFSFFSWILALRRHWSCLSQKGELSNKNKRVELLEE